MGNFEKIIQLDKKDRKILYELDLNARQSNSQIGKKVGLNKNTVNYRINKLLKGGVITGFYTEINIYRLGYKMFRIFIRFQNLTKRVEKEFIDYYVKHPKVSWIFSIEGSYDIIMGVIARTNTEFYNFKEELLYKYSYFVLNIWYNVYVKMPQYKKAYLLNIKNRSAEYKVMGGEEHIKIDETDDKILQILAVNARLPLYELANKLGLSPKVIAYRIKNLIKNDVIQSFRVMLNNNIISYRWYKVHFWLKNVTKERRKQLEQFSIQHPNIIYTNDTIGGPDFEAEFHVKDEEELRGFVSEIRDRFHDIIKDYDVLYYYKFHKNLTYFPTKKA